MTVGDYGKFFLAAKDIADLIVLIFTVGYVKVEANCDWIAEKTSNEVTYQQKLKTTVTFFVNWKFFNYEKINLWQKFENLDI